MKAAAATIDELDYVDKLGKTALYWTAALNDEDSMRTLLYYGADPAKADLNGVGPIHIAASMNAVGCVKMLLGAGVSPHHGDRVGATALHYAAAIGSVEVLDALIEAGKDPDIGTTHGEPPLYFANHGHQNNAAQILIDRGASISQPDRWGYDAILDAVVSDAHDTLHILRGHNASTRIIDGKSVLHIAALNSNPRTIEMLMDFDFLGLDPDCKDDAGHSALECMNQRRCNDDVAELFRALLQKAKFDNTAEKCGSPRSSSFECFYDANECPVGL